MIRYYAFPRPIERTRDTVIARYREIKKDSLAFVSRIKLYASTPSDVVITDKIKNAILPIYSGITKYGQEQTRPDFVLKLMDKHNSIISNIKSKLKEIQPEYIDNLFSEEFKLLKFNPQFFVTSGNSSYNTLAKMIYTRIQSDYDLVKSLVDPTLSKGDLKQSVSKIVKDGTLRAHGIFNDVFDLVMDLEIEIACRDANSKTICEHRREEGYYINQSLNEVRDVIKQILYVKNKDSVTITPQIIDACLDSYCPSLSEKCFNLDPKPTDKLVKSDIFDAIYKELRTLNPSYTSVQSFCNDIIIAVFCVFNISQRANNPPPVPYLDINDLKLLLKKSSNNSWSDSTHNKQFIDIADRIIVQLESAPPQGFNDKLKALTVTTEFTIFKEFVDLVKDTKTSDKNYLTYKSHIDKCIDMIDKSNAVSAIGTLEFVDQLAKFNTVSTVCIANDSNPRFEQLIDEFQELYKGRSTMGGKRKKQFHHTIKKYKK
jgi:hypothetical protein